MGESACVRACACVCASPGDGLQLGLQVQGWEGVDAVLHRPAHGGVAQDVANLSGLHVLDSSIMQAESRSDNEHPHPASLSQARVKTPTGVDFL